MIRITPEKPIDRGHERHLENAAFGDLRYAYVRTLARGGMWHPCHAVGGRIYTPYQDHYVGRITVCSGYHAAKAVHSTLHMESMFHKGSDDRDFSCKGFLRAG